MITSHGEFLSVCCFCVCLSEYWNTIAKIKLMVWCNTQLPPVAGRSRSSPLSCYTSRHLVSVGERRILHSFFLHTQLHISLWIQPVKVKNHNVREINACPGISWTQVQVPTAVDSPFLFILTFVFYFAYESDTKSSHLQWQRAVSYLYISLLQTVGHWPVLWTGSISQCLVSRLTH